MRHHHEGPHKLCEESIYTFFFFTTIGANEEQVKDGLRFTF